MIKKDIKDRIDLLEEHLRDLSEKTTVDSVAENSFYSYRHANRLFKLLKGESINSYANKIRLQVAAEYLKYSSESITQIAFDVGYESTAAFSKAFKKMYKLSPSAFRKSSQLDYQLEDAEKPRFTIAHFDDLKIHYFKITIAPDTTFDEYFNITKAAFETCNHSAAQWMLFWDEDPDLIQVAESRYFMGFESKPEMVYDSTFSQASLKGRYAIFESTELSGIPYEIWHELTILLIILAGKQLREASLIEWFTKSALQNKDSFLPLKIGIPIQ